MVDTTSQLRLAIQMYFLVENDVYYFPSDRYLVRYWSIHCRFMLIGKGVKKLTMRKLGIFCSKPNEWNRMTALSHIPLHFSDKRTLKQFKRLPNEKLQPGRFCWTFRIGKESFITTSIWQTLISGVYCL